MIPTVNLDPASLVPLLSITGCFVMLFIQMYSSRKNEDAVERLEKLEKQLSIITSGSLGMGQRMVALENRLSELKKQQEQISHSDSDFSYTQAQKLLAQGVSLEAVAANSGLSHSEVSLMELLHRHTQKQTNGSNVTPIKQGM